MCARVRACVHACVHACARACVRTCAVCMYVLYVYVCLCVCLCVRKRGPEEEERRLELLLIGKRPKIRCMKEQKRPIKIERGLELLRLEELQAFLPPPCRQLGRNT